MKKRKNKKRFDGSKEIAESYSTSTKEDTLFRKILKKFLNLFCWITSWFCSIRFCIIFFSLVLTFLSTFIGFIIIFGFAMKNVNEVNGFKDHISLSYVNDFVYEFFDEGERVTRQLKIDVEKKFDKSPKISNLSIEELNEWFNIFHSLLIPSKYLFITSYGSESGSTITLVRDSFANIRFGSEYLIAFSDYKDIDNTTGIPGPAYFYRAYDHTGINLSEERNSSFIPHFDHRMMPWWKNSRHPKEDEIFWVNNLSADNNLLTCSVTMKVYNNESVSVGSVFNQYDVSAVNQFLKGFEDILYGGFLGVIDKDSGYFVGTSDDSGSREDENGKLVRRKFEEHDDPVGKIGKLIKTKTSSYQNMSNIQSKFNTFAGTRLYIVGLNSFTVSNFNLLIVTIIPFNVVHKSIITSFWILCLVFLVFFIVVVLFTLLFGYKIISPLNKVIKEMGKIDEMDLDLIKMEKSWFKEVRSLTSNFMVMISKLKLYKTFLPTHLQRIDVIIEEERSIADVNNSTESQKGKDPSKDPNGSSSSSFSSQSDDNSIKTCFSEIVDGLQKLKDGEVEKAKSIFLKHSEKDEIIQKFVGICEIIQSEKISFEQLKRYAKLNTSVFAVFDYFSFIKIKNEEENPEDDINNTIPKNKTETTTVEEEEYICLEDVH